jgi:predicted membrane protein
VFKQSTTIWAIVTGTQAVCVLLTVNVTTCWSADDQLMQICIDFFIAGAIPIGGTLDFLVLMMLLHPEVQQKAQKEIDSIIGRNRLPQLSDKPK